MADDHQDDRDLMEQLYIADDIPLQIDTSLTTLVSKRKAKRVTPESDKDQKYWCKRNRNNVAAKRSRENKRKIELAIRNRVLLLVEENSIMKKEISLLKEKLGMPMDMCLLTQEQKEQCIRAAQESLQSTLSNKRMSKGFTLFDSQLSPSRNSEPSDNSIDDNDPANMEMSDNMTVYGPVNGTCCMAWSPPPPPPPVAVSEPPPAHNAVTMTPSNSDAMMMRRTHQISQWNYGGDRNNPNSHQFYVPFAQAPQGFYACVDPHSSPADLSMKNSKTNVQCDRGRYNHNESEMAVVPTENARMNTGSLHDENATLKAKLMKLSAEVDEMKALILKK